VSRELNSPNGTHDVLPPQSRRWEFLIGTFGELARRSGFGLIVQPMFEDIAVFNRGIGEGSDVARKEMYVFTDRGERTFALRPEGTAPVARAFVQHHPIPPWKVWYATPAFRYERPQAGRYRQHHQLGVEVLGTDDPLVDAEVIALADSFYRSIGLSDYSLLLNSMGDRECRPTFVAVLRANLELHRDELCGEHQVTASENPLRVIDCKKSECRAVVNSGPVLDDFLCENCRSHFAAVGRALDALGINWTRQHNLVRGFDYYNRTTFEFVSGALDGAQNAIGGGGRYDQLVEDLGGDPTSGIGFGSGIERLLLAREAEMVSDAYLDDQRGLDAFVIDTTSDPAVTALIGTLRAEGLAVDRAYDSKSMRSQFKVADRSGAAIAVIIGHSELDERRVTMRWLRNGTNQEPQSVAWSDVSHTIKQWRGK
jgi:histidyl-tRNA synthetase